MGLTGHTLPPHHGARWAHTNACSIRKLRRKLLLTRLQILPKRVEYPAENDSSGVRVQRSANSVLVRESVSGYCAAHIWQENENRKESVKYAGRK